ncbi:MAG: N,N-dimethylformamidase beta subunit family domain-containing protein [Acidimicrobiales bacterium]
MATSGDRPDPAKEKPAPSEESPGKSTVSRRRFLVGGAAALGSVGAACGTASAPRAATKPVDHHRVHKIAEPKRATGADLPTAGWVLAENRKPGTNAWVVTCVPVPHSIEGYPDHVSATVGDDVALHISSNSPTFHVEAYRMGWYQGYGGRLIWQSAETAGRLYAIPPPQTAANTVECNWPASVGFTVTPDWPTGDYLLKLVGSDGQQKLMPFIVRDDSSKSAIVVQNSVTTWQAYNLWGGYSLYYGVDGSGQSYDKRSRIVSFDRPYGLAKVDWADGAGDWLGNDFPFVMLAERLGLDVSYWSDLDFAANPGLLMNHQMLVSLGHDEYWSGSMLLGALDARSKGVNFAFLGANACFRHIRVQQSPIGPDRQVVCYKDPYEDPLYGVENTDVTADWPSGPVPIPECVLIGNMYQSNPVDASLVAADALAWGLAGSGMGPGDSLPHVVGTEYDGYQPGLTGSPTNLEIWCHSRLECRGLTGYSDMTYYAEPEAGGVFATGTNWWVNKLSDNAGRVSRGVVSDAIPEVTSTLTRITTNVLEVFGTGPAGKLKPSVANWSIYYPRGSSSGPPGGVQGA